MASRKRIYDTEFRGEAVRIVTETGKPIPEVAENLDIHPGTLHSWVSRARRNGSPSSGAPGGPPTPPGRGGGGGPGPLPLARWPSAGERAR
ncbi:transposase [Streptomyces prasinus]|uniref:transposase n=1 Tax=Streptomyces prasinus TaxID=67345 RepID=UPI00362E60B9